MASKENNFAASEGGAMLTNTPTAQSSFGMQNLGKNSPMTRPQNGGQQAPENQQNGENGEQGEGNAPASEADALKQAQSQGSPTDQAQKELVKKAGETALTAVGAPQPVAKKLVEEAEKKGILDKINDIINKFKKKKTSTMMSIISAVSPFAMQVLVMILVVAAMIMMAGGIADAIEKVVDLAYGVVEFASGKSRYQEEMIKELPQERYIDKAMAVGLTQEEAIKSLADAWASVLAPVTYKVTSLEDPETELGSIDFMGKNWIGPCQAAMFYAASKQDVCALTFSGLARNGQSYYNSFSGDNLAEKIKKAQCHANTGGWSEFTESLTDFGVALSCANVADEVFYGIQDFIDKKLFDGWLSKFWESFWSQAKHILTGDLTKPEHLEDELKNHVNYSFDEDAYADFLRNYYLEVRYKDFIDAKKRLYPHLTRNEIKEDFISQIITYQAYYSSYFVNEITERLEGQAGSSGEDDLVSKLGSVYGEDSCALLENYSPETHEYTISQGVSNNEIHSVSDGEVIYVKNNTKNLYEYWDSTKQKCICNGKTCEDYNGNEVKIKFEIDNVEFVATYSNLDTINVNVGDLVTKGQVIATEGNTGCTNMKKLKFQLTSESGINYNVDSLLENCSSTSSTMNVCNFNNIKVNLVDCENKLIKTLPLYDYVKENLYLDFKTGINEPELLKAGAVTIVSNILANNDYKVGVNEITIQDCNYRNVNIASNDALKLENSISEVHGEIITYNGKFIATRYNLNCNRTAKDENANSVYNRMCVNKALELAISGKSYSEILEIYYPNYQLNKNYCLTYASAINKYSLNNNKNYISTIEENKLNKINEDLKSRINMVGFGTRAAVVEAARYLSLGLDEKIPYKNGGKYFEIGINPNWANSGLDSCGFISWVLLNGGANIKETLTISKLVKSPNISGNIKINSELYKYYDKIQVGDFAYREDRVGIIIGKNDGVLYIAEANIKEGLIVTTISSYGESDSNYTHIYFADNYYNGTGNVTSMW